MNISRRNTCGYPVGASQWLARGTLGLPHPRPFPIAMGKGDLANANRINFQESHVD